MMKGVMSAMADRNLMNAPDIPEKPAKAGGRQQHNKPGNTGQQIREQSKGLEADSFSVVPYYCDRGEEIFG